MHTAPNTTGLVDRLVNVFRRSVCDRPTVSPNRPPVWALQWPRAKECSSPRGRSLSRSGPFTSCYRAGEDSGEGGWSALRAQHTALRRTYVAHAAAAVVADAALVAGRGRSDLEGVGPLAAVVALEKPLLGRLRRQRVASASAGLLRRLGQHSTLFFVRSPARSMSENKG